MDIAYPQFLASKRFVVPSVGRDVAAEALHPALFPFQRDLVRWALRKGRAALFASTGLGKTIMQLVWAQHAAERVLILAPLAVARQTVEEGDRFGIPVTYARKQADAAPVGITITNYEMLPHFGAAAFGGVVLDESSVLKDFEGKVRGALIRTFAATPARLACTATPAPNDIAELANHAEFLGLLTRAEMLAAFFVHDDQGWRLKGHARQPFFRWLASWGMVLQTPSDLGYADDGYILPSLDIRQTLVPSEYTPPGQLFATALKGVGDRAAVRKSTLLERTAAAARLVEAEPDQQWLCWVGLNDEGRVLADVLPGAVLVEGQDPPERKADALMAFAAGESRVLITKTTIAGFGLNLQRCARMVFCGLSDSYEQYFQAIRRCWRFGQTRPVVAHIVLTEPEEVIYQNVLRKERDAQLVAAELVQYVAEFERAELGAVGAQDIYRADEPMRLPAWLPKGA